MSKINASLAPLIAPLIGGLFPIVYPRVRNFELTDMLLEEGAKVNRELGRVKLRWVSESS